MLKGSDSRAIARQAHAIALQDLERTYRDWLAFIREKQAEVQQRQSLTDEDDLLGVPEQKQTIYKAKLLPPVRKELSNVLRARQQQALEAAETEARKKGVLAPEPDQLYEALLTQIQEELEGKRHEKGWAWVWYLDKLHEFNHQALLSKTSDDDYLTSAKGKSGPSTANFIIVAAIGLIGLLGLVWFGYRNFFYTPPLASSGVSQALIDQQAINLWQPSKASFNGIEVGISAQAGYPLQICVSPKTPLLPETTMVITSTESVRWYNLSSVSTQPDAVVLDCSVSPSKQLASARLIDTKTYETSQLEFTKIIVWGPDTDPTTIPMDRMLVELTSVDKTANTGTLILADGSRYAPMNSMEQSETVIVRYMVPYLAQTQRVGFEQSSTTGLPRLLAFDLPAPVTRLAYLSRVLQIEHSNAALESRDGIATLNITITVSLQEDANPITLIPSDVTLNSGVSQLSYSWEPPRIEPGTMHNLHITLPLPSGKNVDVQLARWRARIPLP